ncbi:sensor histidine kinase [Streptomyces sp. NRRL S-1448]|uniref:sensor histidine kinase n=1 Tax=Streptomyces sp. NRRL S-1448 TaxID=1463883 RepID=UPI0007C5156F|nr:histidine kinase [Streptomyces sp. NRRL S-1448]
MRRTLEAVSPGGLLTATAAVCAALSSLNLLWALPAAVAAFFAGREPGRTGPALLGLVALVAGGVSAVALVPSWLLMAGRFAAVVSVAAMLPWFAGRLWRQHQELVRAGWERAERLEREQRLVAEQARSRERARIAQDMHDVLGHDLSLIALSAGALKLAPGLDEAQRAVAGEIRARAAASVERLGEVIGILREEANHEPYQTPDTGIPRLVADASAAGLAVDLRIDHHDTPCTEGTTSACTHAPTPPATGNATSTCTPPATRAAADSPRTGTAPHNAPPAVARAAHRVVQEALTNAAKHAPTARVSVQVTYTTEETTVRVGNGPSPTRHGPEPVPRTGRGLIGLDERVRLAGGTFTYGPHEGGFAVTARIPHRPSAPRPSATPRTPALALHPEHRRARNSVRRALVTALVLPLVVWAALCAALIGWDIRSARLSVLDPGDYARLRLGQDQDAVRRLLPERETIQRPVAGEPKGNGITCEYFAMTADRFDDRSGDAYRLCFRDGRLMSKEALTR